MGASLSSARTTPVATGGAAAAAVTVVPHTTGETNAEDELLLLRAFNLSQPTAAVVGAGMAGVHVAHELAELGFRVTVFDERPGIAEGGGTQFGLPFVGVGLLEPGLATLPVRREVWRQVLLPTACPALITRESVWNVVVSPIVRHWFWARAHVTQSADEVMWHTNNLARLSVSAVHELLAKYPELHRHVVSSSTLVQVGRLARTDRGAAAAEPKRGTATTTDWVATKTAHAVPLVIDPVGWTRTLATICAREKGVEFVLKERVERANVHLKYDVENTRSLTVSHSVDAANDGSAQNSRRQTAEQRLGTRVYAERSFDVVVVTAGADTARLLWSSAKLPIVAMRGWSLTLSHAPHELAGVLRRLFPPVAGRTSSVTETEREVTEVPCAPALVNLSSACQLFAYRICAPSPPLPSSSPSATPVLDAVDPIYRLTGLLSLDTTHAMAMKLQTRVRRELARMEAYLRVYCGIEVPLVHAQQRAPEAVQVTDYVRAFSVDGVPVVDRCGGSFNTFVCSAFGDHTADFAPGAAKLLRNLVERQAHRLLEKDQLRVKEEYGVMAHRLPSPQLATLEREWTVLVGGALPPPRRAASGKAWHGEAGPRAAMLTPWLRRWRPGRTSAIAADGHSTRLACGDNDCDRATADAGAQCIDTAAHSRTAPTRRDNPFASARSCGATMMPSRFDTYRHPLVDLVPDLEAELMRRYAQMYQWCTRHAVRMSVDEKLPYALRMYIFRNHGTIDTDDELRTQWQQYADKRRKLIEERESGATEELLERSLSRQSQLQLSARQVARGHG